MSPPRRKTIFFGVLLLAIVALAVDRLLLQSPASANAAVDAAPAAASSVADREPDTSQAEAAPRPSLFPANLSLETWSPGTRSPFDWPEPLAERRRKRLAGIQDEPSSRFAGRKPGEPLTVEQFMNAHRLRGVFVDGPAAAIIDDQLIEVGQEFDGSELLRVNADAAFFQCQDGIAELTIASSP